RVARDLPDSSVWQFLSFHFDHAAWEGGGFWDMIQPSFMFMVGVAMPYSHASRLAKGQSSAKIAGHVVFRALLLIALGVFLSSNWSKQTNYTFVNVLSQIGLGYAFLYLLIGRGLVVQMLALVGILGGYWLYFYLFEVPGPDFNFASVGFGPNKFHPYEGLFA